MRIEYAPQGSHRSLPVEVLDRSVVLARRSRLHGHGRELVRFNVLVVCVAGRGTHVVDFETVELTVGTCLRIHPGQVQRYVTTPSFEARMVVWPADTALPGPVAEPWYPGSGRPTRWQLQGARFDRVLGAVDELRDEQGRFDGSPGHAALLRALLAALVLRVAVEDPAEGSGPEQLPEPYRAFRVLVEERFHLRPTVTDLAGELGYSTRTLDRAAKVATGTTAKQVLDDRLGLEIRRLLTHTDRSLASIAATFSFDDVSNFSRFVKRLLGASPGQLRAAA